MDTPKLRTGNSPFWASSIIDIDQFFNQIPPLLGTPLARFAQTPHIKSPFRKRVKFLISLSLFFIIFCIPLTLHSTNNSPSPSPSPPPSTKGTILSPTTSPTSSPKGFRSPVLTHTKRTTHHYPSFRVGKQPFKPIEKANDQTQDLFNELIETIQDTPILLTQKGERIYPISDVEQRLYEKIIIKLKAQYGDRFSRMQVNKENIGNFESVQFKAFANKPEYPNTVCLLSYLISKQVNPD